MILRRTAVINAARRGTRMGQSRPKCLTPILGRLLVEWQLLTLSTFEEVVVVVGYQAQDVIAAVSKLRSDAVFVTNSEFGSTGTAASLSLALEHARFPVVSIDGDLLVHPNDLLVLTQSAVPSIGVSEIQSLAPVLVSARCNAAGLLEAIAFHHGEPPLPDALTKEWTGLVTISPKVHTVRGTGHVYQMIRTLLPCPAIHVRCREIDYPEEVPAMEEWLRDLIDQGTVHG
ncbi:MAG: NTP transferase domain-containing protein [Accumulibacter sp.]|uniref:NTP transferase domain-containing protein n=1 Tax=Accumulibacter sp. TaxID=2053492 RepID=UPI002FC34E19